MGKALGWGALLTLGLLLVVLGATGRVGSALGALITPANMQDVQQGS